MQGKVWNNHVLSTCVHRFPISFPMCTKPFLEMLVLSLSTFYQAKGRGIVFCFAFLVFLQKKNNQWGITVPFSKFLHLDIVVFYILYF